MFLKRPRWLQRFLWFLSNLMPGSSQLTQTVIVVDHNETNVWPTGFSLYVYMLYYIIIIVYFSGPSGTPFVFSFSFLYQAIIIHRRPSDNPAWCTCTHVHIILYRYYYIIQYTARSRRINAVWVSVRVIAGVLPYYRIPSYARVHHVRIKIPGCINEIHG